MAGGRGGVVTAPASWGRARAPGGGAGWPWGGRRGGRGGGGGGPPFSPEPRGPGPPRSNSSSRRRSRHTCSRSSRRTTGMSPRPRAHWRCPAAICTRKSSATGWPGRGSGRDREGQELGQGDGRGRSAAQAAAERRSHTGPRQRADRETPGGGRRPRLRGAGRGGGAAERRWLARDVGEGGTGRADRRRGHPGGVAVLPRVWPAADLLSGRRRHGHRHRPVGEHRLVEAPHGRRARRLTDPDRLGRVTHDARGAASRVRRQSRVAVAVPGRGAPLTADNGRRMTETFKNFIAGDWVAPTTGAYFENRNPADWDDVIGCFPRSGPEDVALAVASAQRGFATWSRTPAPIRGEVLHRVGDLLVQRKEEIARAMAREMGKVLAETRGDVQEGIDTAHYAHTEGRRLFGRTVPSELGNKWAMSFRRPIGVAGLITPLNFPLAIPTWKMFPALLCGNAVLFKPAEDVPHTAHLLVEILLEAGLPPAGVQLLHRGGSGVGQAVVGHAEVPLVPFTRSTQTGAVIRAAC